MVNRTVLLRDWSVYRLLDRAHGTRVPIAVMAGMVMPGDRERCLAADMDDYLVI